MVNLYPPMSSLLIKQIQVGPMMNFSYLVGDTKGCKAAIIDPCWEADKLIAKAQESGLSIISLIATHSHFDHVNAAEALSNQLKIPIYVHEADAKDLPKQIKIIKTRDDDEIDIADQKIKCIHTPGHTPGSQCFLIDGNLFTGDTLFVGNCGRIDLPGGNEKELNESLKKLSHLPDGTKIYPGHDYGEKKTSTIGWEKHHNPFMCSFST